MGIKSKESAIQIAFGDVFLQNSKEHEKHIFVILGLRENDCLSAELLGENKNTLSLFSGTGSTTAQDIHSLIGRLTREQILEAFKRDPDFPRFTDFFEEQIKPFVEDNSKKPPIWLTQALKQSINVSND